jgi:hypothetical protein
LLYPQFSATEISEEPRFLNYAHTIQFTVLDAATSPSVTLKRLKPERYLIPSSIRLEAVAVKEGGGIRGVQFHDGINLIGTVEQPPYVLTWTNSLSPPGPHWITASATDDAGVTITSDALKVFFHSETAVPYVDVVEPRDGSSFVVGKPIVMRAKVQLNDNNTQPVEFWAGTNLLGTSAQPPYEITVTNLASGSHTLRARTTKLTGESGTGVPAMIRVGEVVLRDPKQTAQGFEMDAEGIVIARTNLVQVSSNLTDWFPIITNVPTGEVFHFLDPDPLNASHRFYRVLIR